MDRKVIVVLGATGGQGSGVVDALLKDTSQERWLVRAVTRDPESARARKLLTDYQTSDERLSIVRGDPYDLKNLQDIFQGAYGLFALVSELVPGKILQREEELVHELEGGRNIVDAAKHNKIAHFVFSSMPDMDKVTSGRYTRMFHMTNKFKVEQYAREHLENVTCLIPGFFYGNHRWSQYAQRRADGVVRFCAPIPGNQLTEWADSEYDVGQFACKVFSLGIEKTREKVYPIVCPKITPDDMASIFTAVTGQPAIHDPMPLDEWSDVTASMLGPAFREDVKEMMEWMATVPEDKTCYGAFDLADNRSQEELGLSASTFADWLKRTGWTGP